MNLIEIDPLILGMGLGDVAGSKDHAGQAGGAEWAGVRAIRYADDPRLMSGPVLTASLSGSTHFSSRGTRAGRLTQGWSNSIPSRLPRRSARNCLHRRGRCSGCSPGIKSPIDLDLAPVGNDVDALPSLDSADREAGRADNRVGHCCSQECRRTRPGRRGPGPSGRWH